MDQQLWSCWFSLEQTHIVKSQRWVQDMKPQEESLLPDPILTVSLETEPQGGSVLKDQLDSVCMCVCVCVGGVWVRVCSRVLDSITETMVTALETGSSSPPAVTVIFHHNFPPVVVI